RRNSISRPDISCRADKRFRSRRSRKVSIGWRSRSPTRSRTRRSFARCRSPSVRRKRGLTPVPRAPGQGPGVNMSSRARRIAAVGVLVLLCVSNGSALAQSSSRVQAVTHVASLAPGAIQGTVQDEMGLPVAGATVSAFGTSTAVAVTDRIGRFELRSLSPGPYLLRAHLTGFVASRGQLVEVRPSARVSSAIAVRRVGSVSAPASPLPVLAAGIGGGSSSDPDTQPTTENNTSSAVNDDHGEVAWRLRHARRGILKDAMVPIDMLEDDAPATNAFGDSG